MLIDNHGRKINYLRLAVTDRCNLRCTYCMPESGINFMPRHELMTYEEMLQLMTLLSAQGINKLRITGGEPFVRKDLIDFLEELALVPGLDQISITTNATLIGPFIQRLKQAGIIQINVSLDALDAKKFFQVTRRDAFETVFENLMTLIHEGFEVKINCIVLDGKNIDQMLPLVEFTKNHPVAVRFLEEMPFNGSGLGHDGKLKWNHQAIYDHIAAHHPNITSLTSEKSSTSVNYQIPGHTGTFGIIPAYSRTFCGTCNRIRISAKGEMRTCLYGKNVVSFRSALQLPDPETEILRLLHQALGTRFANGVEAERASQQWESMTSIGG